MDEQTNTPGMSEPTFTPDAPTPELIHAARPSVAPWVAVISIVLGSLGLLCWGSQLSAVFSGYSGGELPEGMPDMSMAHRTLESTGLIAGVVLGIMLIAGGIGGYAHKTWAPRLLQTWAVLRIIVAIIGLVATFMYIDDLVQMQQAGMQQAIAEASDKGDAPEVPNLSDESLRAIIMVFMCVLTLAVCIWPIFILCLVRKRTA